MYGWIILVIIVLVSIATQHHIEKEDMKLKVLTNYQPRTGDIVYFRNMFPILFRGSNGLNLDFPFAKNMLWTIMMLSQKYTHVGMMVNINGSPYLFHLSSHHYLDRYSGKWVIGKPSLLPMAEAMQYEGYAHVVRYKGPEKKVDVSRYQDIKIDGNTLNIIGSTLLNLYDRPEDTMTCVDLIATIMEDMGLRKAKKPETINTLKKFTDASDLYDDPVIWANGYYQART